MSNILEPPADDAAFANIGPTVVCPCCRRAWSVLEIFTEGRCGWCTSIKCRPRPNSPHPTP